MGLYAFLPFAISLALVIFFAFGWKRENANLEAIKVSRAKLHSVERAAMAAQYFRGFCEVKIIGVLHDGDNLMIGYRKKHDPNVSTFPGERVYQDDVVEGTIITWPTEQETSAIAQLCEWHQQSATVYMRVTESGENLIFADPEIDVTISIGLMPSNL